MWNALSGDHETIGGPTLAEGIAVKNVGKLTLPIVRALVSDIVLVDEAQLERAVNAYLTLQKTMAEGAGAAGLAAMLAEPERFRGRKVGLILCGGNIDPRILASIMVRELEREDRIVSFRLTIPDRPGVLGQIATRLGQLGANILEVDHQRLFLDVPAKGARLDVTVETRDRAHADEIFARSTADGYAAGAHRDRERDGMSGSSRPLPPRGVPYMPVGVRKHLGAEGRAMREKELRIALVCFGGVSLAVYMHGISKEILKLVRASSALHAHRRPRPPRKGVVLRRCRRATIRNTTPRRSISSCCARSAAEVELRVIVDIIAGASAGGINGTMLARALEPRPADGTAARPLARQCRRDGAAVAGGKGRHVEQVVSQARSSGAPRAPDGWARSATARFAHKLSLFVRSRWFKPPLDGGVMARSDVRRRHRDGRAEAPRRVAAAVRPIARPVRDGHRLPRLSPARAAARSAAHSRTRASSRSALHLPPPSRRRGRERLRARQRARRSPSRRARPRRFPGAFPPARIVEMDEVAAESGGHLAAARRLHRAQFPSPPARRRSIRPRPRSSTARCSTTGRSSEAISAIQGRPAYRQVDRRLVYIEPDPAPPEAPAHRNVPGFFSDPARRHLGHPAHAAGDRRAVLGRGLQRPGPAAQIHHRERPARTSAGWSPR